MNDCISPPGLLFVGRHGGRFTHTGTVKLNGVNTYAGPLMVNSGATLAPGGSFSTLTVNGDLTLSAGSTNTFEVNASTPANDAIALGGNVAYDGVLNIVPSGHFTAGQTFTLFSGAGAASSTNITVNPDLPTAFYRLVYP